MSELLESAWKKGHKPLTKEEAGYVWDEVHAMAQAYPDGSRLLWLFGKLDVELGKGQRCAVCGRHSSENYDCAREC